MTLTEKCMYFLMEFLSIFFSRLYFFFFALDDVISILSHKSQKLKKVLTFKEKVHRRRRRKLNATKSRSK